MKQIVISAVNLRKGGTLTILRQCLSFLSSWAPSAGYKVVALVHKRELVDFPHIEYIELPRAASSWSKRLWCEYVTMGKIARELGDIELWLSLHDTTPRVKAKRQAVYCQTSFPFLRWRWRDFCFDKKIPLFAMLTRFAYQLGIRRNRYLIVQQEWLRDGFSQMFELPKERFLVAPPPREALPALPDQRQEGAPYTFLYAATPDGHKNFEFLCEATRRLEDKVGKGKFRVVLTIDGTENKYARWIHAQWGDCSSLSFRGFLSCEELQRTYAATDCLVFPSRIETWGLPISEFLPYGRPMLLADLPYARETASGAAAVRFFDPTKVEELVQAMEQVLRGDLENFQRPYERPHQAKTINSWEELLSVLLS